MTIGSAAKSLTSKPSATFMRLTRFLGRQVGLAGRLGVVEAEFLLGEGEGGEEEEEQRREEHMSHAEYLGEFKSGATSVRRSQSP